MTASKQQEDMFANWMCSWSIEQSLWTCEEYKKALLAYIGRIYGQTVHMYRIFAQLKSYIKEFDELDVLNQLIENAKQRRGVY